MTTAKEEHILLALYRKLGTARSMVILVVLYIISQISIGLIIQPIGPDKVLQLQTTFSRDTFMAILQGWGDAGIERYKMHFYLDFFHPFIYALTLSSLIAGVTGREKEAPGKWALMLFMFPVIPAIMDLIENILHLALISDPKDPSGFLIILSAMASNIKWLCAGACLLFIIFSLIKNIFKRK